MDPPPSHHLHSSSAAAPSHPSDPAVYTPMSPYKPPNPVSYSLPHLPFPPNSTVFYPPSSSNGGQNPYLPFLRPNSAPIPQPAHPAEKLRNEVIFLHQLWHQGPPNPTSIISSFADPVGNLQSHLKPSHSTAFKTKKKKNPTSVPVSDIPWPVPPDSTPPPHSDSAWPPFPPRPTLPASIFSEELRDRVSGTTVHQNAMNSFRSLFAGTHGPESESESDDEDCHDQDHASDDDDPSMLGKFLEVFEGNVELKEYYEKNWAGGEFLCFVCGGTGMKMAGRKYKNCLALVQHTVTVSNTKRKEAHRAYGLALCKVLGWDIHQLPLVSRNLSLHQGNDMSNMTSAEACKDDYVGVEANLASVVNGNEQSGPSMASTSTVFENDAIEKKEASDLPSILDRFFFSSLTNRIQAILQGNDMSNMNNAEACKDDHVASLVNGNEESGPSMASTSNVLENDANEKKEASELPSILDNPGPCDLQGNETSNVEACRDDPVSFETDIASGESDNTQSETSKANSEVGGDTAAEKKETYELPLVRDDPGDQEGL